MSFADGTLAGGACMLTLPSLALELTPRCNQRCVYCYNPWRGRPAAPGDELGTAALRALVDRILAQAELGHVTLTGGEPFLRDDLVGLIDHGRSGPGSIEATVGGIARLAEAGVPVGGSFLCTHRNFAAAGATLRLMHQAGVRSHFAFNRFNPSGHAAAHLPALLPTRSDVLAALAAADRFAAEHDLTVHCTMPIPHCMVDEGDYPRIGFGQCSAGGDQGEYAVDPQGRLKLCTLQRRVLGSLFEASLAELVASEPARRFRRMIPAFCEACPHREGCLGGCGAAAEWVFGRADELDPFLAQHVMVDFPKRVAILGSTAGP